jgi:L-alanine-DL-glutamate epimerase-like enolase superfamily enzyme
VTSSKRSGSLLKTPFNPDHGVLRVSSGAGLGIELDDEEVARRLVTNH